MKKTSILVTAVSVLGLGAALVTPAHAQRAEQAQKRAQEKRQKAQGGEQAQAQTQAAAGQRKFNFTAEARKALSELQTAANAGDTANFPAKLAAAQAAAKNTDDRYFIAQMQLNMAQKANDEAAKRAAVTAIINSGGALPDELPKLYRAQADMALNAKDYDTAVSAYNKVLQLQPGDANVLTNLIILHRDRKNYPQAMAVVRQAIDAGKSSGRPASESLYRLGLQTALDTNNNAMLAPLTREFLAAYPTPANWSTGLDLYRQSVGSDGAVLLDTFRLMRAAKTLDQSNEILSLAENLAVDRFYAEARDVVNEGIASGKVNASSPRAKAVLQEVNGKIAADKAALTGLEGRARSEAAGSFSLKIADAYYGHGNYAKAAEFYRLALQKGSVDANLANTRLGMALALSGQRPAAEAAFKAVSGKRADLAGLWMLWLSQRA